MPRDGVQRHARGNGSVSIIRHASGDLEPRWCIAAIHGGNKVGQDHRCPIGGAAKHDAGKARHLAHHPVNAVQTAIQDDIEIGPPCGNPRSAAIIKRGNVAVLLWAEAVQPRLAGVKIDHRHTGIGHGVDERIKAGFRVHIINPDPAFDRYRQVGGRTHRRHAVGNQHRFRHQAGTKTSRLHAVGRAADIQIDLGIAVIRSKARCRSKPCRVAATKLQRNANPRFYIFRCLRQQPVTIAMHNRIGCHHFGEQQCVGRDVAVEMPAMPVRPVHHRCHAQASVQRRR